MENLNKKICRMKSVEQITSRGENIFATHNTESKDSLFCSQEPEAELFLVHKILFHLEHEI
jgi:hypothetical protein